MLVKLNAKTFQTMTVAFFNNFFAQKFIFFYKYFLKTITLHFNITKNIFCLVLISIFLKKIMVFRQSVLFKGCAIWSAPTLYQLMRNKLYLYEASMKYLITIHYLCLKLKINQLLRHKYQFSTKLSSIFYDS